VWLVENGTVRLTPVQVGSSSGNDILLVAGVKPGQTVVTAGVNLLKNGQRVKILALEAPPAADTRQAPATGAGAAK
jgi:hypothetical protein